MKKTQSLRPGPKVFGGKGHTTPNISSLHMALARDHKKSHNHPKAPHFGAYGFNYGTRKGGQNVPKWLA